MFPKACLPAANNRIQGSSLPFICYSLLFTNALDGKTVIWVSVFRSSHQAAVGVNRLGQPESPWNVPLSPLGMSLRFSSAKNIHISAGQNFWFSLGLNCKVKISSSRNKCFLRHTKKKLSALRQSGLSLPWSRLTRSKLLVGNCVLQDCYAASSDNFLPTFRNNPTVSSSWILDPWRWDR